MKKVLKYFMWGYQQHYRYNIQKYAEELFGGISTTLKPNVFLIGILRKETEDNHPLCIEPEECGIDVNLFNDVDKLAESIYEADPRKNLFHTDPHHHQRVMEDLKKECLHSAVKQIVDKNFEGRSKVSFVSYPAILDSYEIFVVLQFDEEDYNSFYSLNRSEIKIHELRTAKVRKSLIDALVYVYLNEAIDPLYKPRPGVYMDDVKTDKKELLRIAASNFIGTAIPAASQSRGSYELFDVCNYISSLKYEGDSSIGRLIICKEDHPNLNIILKLKNPILLSDHRKVRKLLEIASGNLHLYSNGDYILGFVELKGVYDEKREDLFIVNFSGSHKWELIHGSHNIMMVVEYTNPSLPRSKVDKSNFDDILKRIFGKISENDLEKLWTIVNISTEQKHGTLIIVSSEAEKEAKRLENQSTSIEPVTPDKDLIKNITSIDGAVLLDTHGVCYSIGAILDGIATLKGNSARGARFNSAIRYVETKRKKCVAVIISEDGMVDLYPQLRPQIRKSDIATRLMKLREEVNKEKVDYDVYRPLMNWFWDHEFYLSKEYCDEINKLKGEFNSKVNMEVGAIYIQYPDFKPNPEMDDSYFIDQKDKGGHKT